MNTFLWLVIGPETTQCICGTIILLAHLKTAKFTGHAICFATLMTVVMSLIVEQYFYDLTMLPVAMLGFVSLKLYACLWARINMELNVIDNTAYLTMLQVKLVNGNMSITETQN